MFKLKNTLYRISICYARKQHVVGKFADDKLFGNSIVYQINTYFIRLQLTSVSGDIACERWVVFAHSEAANPSTKATILCRGRRYSPISLSSTSARELRTRKCRGLAGALNRNAMLSAIFSLVLGQVGVV